MGPFMFHNTVSMTLMAAAPGIFSLPEIQSVSTPWTIFSTKAHCGKPIFAHFQTFFD